MSRPAARAWILAFDGIVADTMSLRSRALADGFAEEGIDIADISLNDVLCGRTFPEAVRHLTQSHAKARTAVIDETTIDLVALRAARRATALFAMGVSLLPDVRHWMVTHGGAGDRIALRADSSRSDVVHLLDLAGLEVHVGLLVCADDASEVSSRRGPSLDRSWSMLDRRLGALGGQIDGRTAIEPCPRAADVATRYASAVFGALTPVI